MLTTQEKHNLCCQKVSCVSENEMFPCQGELCNWERSYRAATILTTSLRQIFTFTGDINIKMCFTCFTIDQHKL